MSILELAALLAIALHLNDTAAMEAAEAALRALIPERDFAELLAALMNASAAERVWVAPAAV